MTFNKVAEVFTFEWARFFDVLQVFAESHDAPQFIISWKTFETNNIVQQFLAKNVGQQWFNSVSWV